MMQTRKHTRALSMSEPMSDTRRLLFVAAAVVTSLSFLATELPAQGQGQGKGKSKEAKGQQVGEYGQGQGKGKANGNGKGNGVKSGKIPPGHMPSAGECRVWFDGRPPGQQPSPTSCARAQADAARSGGRVVYGGDRDDRRYDRYDDDRDIGRYPNDARYPATLPEMVWGVLAGQGQRVDGAQRWLDRSDARARVVDANRDGRPESVTWYDNANRVLQQWQDVNGDGRADRVQFYENNAPGRVIRGKK